MKQKVSFIEKSQNSLFGIVLILMFMSNVSFSQPPCSPPIVFNAGSDVIIACGASAQLGEIPTPDYSLTSTCVQPGMWQSGSLTQGGGIYLNDVVTTGGAVNINNTNTLVDVGNIDPMGPSAWMTIWFSDFSSQYVEACAGSTFYLNINAISLYNNTSYYCRVWVDWNNDGDFGAAEIVYSSPPMNTHPNISILNIAIPVPAGLPYGAYRMRIRFKDNAPFVASDGACTFHNSQGVEAPYGGYTGSQTGDYYFSDEIEDYSVHVNCGNSYVYSWSPANSLDDPSISNPVATPSDTTTYTVTITDLVNNCVTIEEVTVALDPPCILLPVELASFEVVCDESITIFSWSTASELNSDYFQLEKSMDGVLFSAIGEVDASGNSNNLINYKYELRESTGAYYRLNMVDVDGTSEYSDLVWAKCFSNGVSVFPTIVESSFYLSVYGQIELPIHLEIVDNMGRIVQREFFTSIEGEKLIYLSNTKPGMFIVQVYDDNGSLLEREKILVL
ncbi:MAG: T9SS type A sorting domain-containing protein [Crocinitomicaceae bacterium]|nr:GEVED domain-containing protein [Flavobacteriales bacterium]NQZ38411.1 T9SS type A sorting domain-containing protein [Crocinitomicaceae bacterium]